MSINLKHNVLIILMVLFGACVKPYDFDPQNFEKALVIDGQVTDEPGPYSVSITYTYPLDTVLKDRVSNAKVWVEDDAGNIHDYTEGENGNYTSSQDFRGEAGTTYQLFVEMPNGDRYNSEAQTLQTAPPISRIYGSYSEQPTDEGDRNVGGMQFFIDSELGDARHFRYEWEEAYKIVVPYPALYRLAPDSSIIPLDTPKGICYEELVSNSLIYGTSVGTSENRMVEFPVRFVSQELQQLRVRYSILVRQFAISESAFLFYKRLNENNESGGSLFDQQTGSVFGNISSETNPDQAVLGFFEVSGVTEKRAFFSRGELDDQLNVAGFPYACHFTQTIVTTPDSATYYLDENGGNIFQYSPMPPEISIQSRSCTDCSFYADVIPPDYWTE